MHYYKHYIGDYRRDTSHLTLLEHGIYRQLIDSYCLDEVPLTNDLAKLMRSHSVRSAEEQQALQNVLTDFFELTENGYIHKRCEKTVAEYHGKSDKARQSANARWHRENNGLQSSDANAMQTHTEGNANHKPLTINQEPIKNNKRAPRFDAVRHLVSLGVFEQVAKDYCQQRKKKPTMTAIDGIYKQATKAGISLNKALEICCARGWEGFKAEWVKDKPQPGQQLTPYQQSIKSAGISIFGNLEEQYAERNITPVAGRLDSKDI